MTYKDSFYRILRTIFLLTVSGAWVAMPIAFYSPLSILPRDWVRLLTKNTVRYLSFITSSFPKGLAINTRQCFLGKEAI